MTASYDTQVGDIFSERDIVMRIFSQVVHQMDLGEEETRDLHNLICEEHVEIQQAAILDPAQYVVTEVDNTAGIPLQKRLDAAIEALVKIANVSAGPETLKTLKLDKECDNHVGSIRHFSKIWEIAYYALKKENMA